MNKNNDIDEKVTLKKVTLKSKRDQGNGNGSPLGDRYPVTSDSLPAGKPILLPGIDEESDQVLLVNWVNRTYPHLAHKLHHSPNGGYRDKRTGHRMKLMGTKPGFHDLVFFHPHGNYTGLAIELKIGNGRLSPSQLKWIPVYQECGFLVKPCWGYQEAVDVFEQYLTGG